MIGRLVLAACAAAFAIGAAGAADDDFAKQATDATRPLQLDLAPDGSPVPSDLTLDADFGSGGLKSIWPPGAAGWSDTEDGLRAFPWIGSVTLPGPPPVVLPNVHKGYYVVGRQKNTAGTAWRAWIARMNLAGAVDTTFGTDGWIYTIEVDDVVDAAVVGDKAYILGNIRTTAQAIPAALVQCKDLTYAGSNPNAGYCFPTGAGILTFGADPAGPRTAAYAQRLAHDGRYGVFVAARVVNTSRGQEVGVARISADTGSLVAEFKDGGYNIGLPSWAPAAGAEIAVNALAVTPEGYAGIARVYVAGQMKRNAADHDGYILGLAPTNGILTTGWNWNERSYYYEDDNTGYRKDAITALAPLRNGKVAFAGWSETDDASLQPMFMGRVNGDGSYDESFCRGNANRGERGCMVEQHVDEFYKPVSQPVAMAERRQNRDLVVALRSKNNGSMPPTNVITRVEQYGANGNRVHAALNLDYAGSSGTAHWSRPFGMWMGGTGIAGLGEEVIAVVGTRLYADPDFDATITHIKATDSIFADAFGGAFSD